MKSIQSWGGPGQLKLEYYETWAKYQIKFFEEYLKENITFWAMSTGNEPYSLGFSEPPEETNAMSWTVYEFVINYLSHQLNIQMHIILE